MKEKSEEDMFQMWFPALLWETRAHLGTFKGTITSSSVKNTRRLKKQRTQTLVKDSGYV